MMEARSGVKLQTRNLNMLGNMCDTLIFTIVKSSSAVNLTNTWKNFCKAFCDS